MTNGFVVRRPHVTTQQTLRRSPVRDRGRFVVLPENRFAFAAAETLAQRPRRGPAALLTIDGAPGVGKSHICDHVLQQSRLSEGESRAMHVTGAEFAQEWDEACRNRFFRQFQESYAACDLLVCEDVQGMRRRRRAQEALVQIVDQVIAREGRVIFTLARPPRKITGLSQRLVNRCHGGVTAHVALPSSESRALLLDHFAKLHNVPVSADAVRLLAREFAVSPRELAGLATRLAQQSRQQSQMVDLAFAQQLVDTEPLQSQNTVPEISREVARQFGVALRILRSDSRSAKARIPRQAAMYLARELTSSPCQSIGKYFNGRSHSTVVHACQRFEEQLESDLALQPIVENIRKSLCEERRTGDRRKRVNKSGTRRSSAG
ncbi:MAG: hypothetical protein DWQ45_03725 [Planctomycetota bacterium]|nr:MAG: hypothetical protein DWQ41_16745 [Planctomycetota bacterium]REK38959.1 MAG: hypothetical protein DWQ45_03725 [Planctomycetota bacterium]